MVSRFFFFLAIVQFLAGSCIAVTAEPTIDVTAKYVVDADTIVIAFPDGEEARTRLCGIDAPEMKQDFGNDASTILKKLLEQKRLSVEIVSVDRYDRLVVNMFADGVLLNRELVSNGAAWVYPRYARGCWKPAEVEKMFSIQQRAQEQRIGLWRADNPNPPWSFRRQKK